MKIDDDPTRHIAYGIGQIDTIVGILLAGQIALEAVNPHGGEDGRLVRAHAALEPREAIRLGEWLIAAGRVSADLAADPRKLREAADA